MRRQWKVDEDFAFIIGGTWFIAGMATFLIIRMGEGRHLHRPPLSETAVISLVVWLAPFALGLMYLASLLVRWLWSIRPKREWETAEDARQAHKEGRL